MRLLLTCDPGIPVPPAAYGGIERIVDSLVREYRRLGHQVALWADPRSTCPADAFSAWDGQPGAWAATLRASLHLKKFADGFRPDVLHSFSRLGLLLPLLPKPLPKIMSYQRHTGGPNLRLARHLSRGTLHFTGCSNFICRMGSRAGGDWHCVPNFVKIDCYTFRPEVPPDAPLVFLSRIESIKGPDWAIEIARKSGRRLILAGNRPESGPELDFWRARVEPHLGKDGVEWIGPVNDAQKNDLLGSAAALLVPIQWDEPFGIVFPEALACGTPVISCPRGALPEIIEHGRHGYLVRSVSEGVHAVKSLSSISRKTCREQVESRYSLHLVADRYLALYEGLLLTLQKEHSPSFPGFFGQP